MSDETPELPGWLADQLDAIARDEAEAVAAAWERIAAHVPPEIVAELPDDVLIGLGPERGAFRFLDAEGKTVAELRLRPEGLATLLTELEVIAFVDGAVTGRIAMPRTTGPPADPSAN